jgi:hypothetical protein
MQAWYGTVLTAARKIDPGATLSAATGIATIGMPASGKAIQLTAVKQQDNARYGVTPEQLIQSELTGQPIVLSPAGLAQSRSDQIAALVQVRDQTGATPATKSAAQTAIDQLQAFWSQQDEAAKPKPPAPTPTPAASDAWRNLPVGSIVTIEGVTYKVASIGGCGNMLCKLKAPPAPTPPANLVTFKAACVEHVRAELMTIDNEEAQGILGDFLTWMSAQ